MNSATLEKEPQSIAVDTNEILTVHQAAKVLDTGVEIQGFINVPKLLTVPEVARWLSVSASWVRDHATGRRRPALPCVKLGKSLRFEGDVVAKWLEALRQSGRAA